MFKTTGGQTDEPRSILVVLPTWVGDFVMATPFLRAIRTRFAAARITFLSEPSLRDLMAGGDWMNDDAFWPRRGQRKPWHKAYRALRCELRARRFDLAILLPNSFRAALLAWQCGAKRRVGYDRDWRGLLLTDRVKVKNRVNGKFVPLPLVEYYADLAEVIGCERPSDRLELFTTAECDAAVEARLRQCGVPSDRPLVVFNPGASFGASKCWLPERFAAVADRLVGETKAAILITCGPGEEPLARATAAAMNQPGIVLENPILSLGELKSLIRRCALLVGNDTGPRHFAKAFGVPLVTVFGPTFPEWTATNYPLERIVRIDVDCGPCHQRECPLGHLKCMTGVTVDAVHAACAELLRATNGPRVPHVSNVGD